MQVRELIGGGENLAFHLVEEAEDRILLEWECFPFFHFPSINPWNFDGISLSIYPVIYSFICSVQAPYPTEPLRVLGWVQQCRPDVRAKSPLQDQQGPQ